MLLYGTVPVMVFASRTAMPENVIALFYAISVYLLLKFRSKKNFWWIFPIPILAGIAGLCKPTGYFILPFTLFFVFKWLYKDGKLKLAIRYCLYLVALVIPFIAAFFVYGIKMDAEIFWHITSIQGTRPVGFGSLAWFFYTPSYHTEILRDSFFMFCLLSAAYYLFAPKEGIKKIAVFAFVYWVGIVMFSGGENDLLAWYRFPSYPFLAILGAWGVAELIKKADFFSTFLAGGFFLGNRMLLVNAFRHNVSPNTFRAIFAGIMIPPILLTIFGGEKLKNIVRILIVLLFLFGIYMNVVYIYQAYGIACEGAECLLVDSTPLAGLRFPFFIRWFILELPKLIIW
jgi:hypothetical protein